MNRTPDHETTYRLEEEAWLSRNGRLRFASFHGGQHSSGWNVYELDVPADVAMAFRSAVERGDADLAWSIVDRAWDWGRVRLIKPCPWCEE